MKDENIINCYIYNKYLTHSSTKKWKFYSVVQMYWAYLIEEGFVSYLNNLSSKKLLKYEFIYLYLYERYVLFQRNLDITVPLIRI